jgi:anti-anti-sigma factor
MAATNDHDQTPGAILSITSWREGTRAVVELEGELDLSGSDRLTDEMHAVLADSVDSVEFHAPRLSFIDSSGLVAVLRARAEAESTGVSCYMSDVSRRVGDVIEMTGLDELLLRPE